MIPASPHSSPDNKVVEASHLPHGRTASPTGSALWKAEMTDCRSDLHDQIDCEPPDEAVVAHHLPKHHREDDSTQQGLATVPARD